MPLTPRRELDRPEAGAGAPESPPVRLWHEMLVGLLFAILCFEMGVFLLAFPWSRYWAENYFSWVTEGWREVWMNPFVRGAVSGLGLVNLYVSLLEIFRLQHLRSVRTGRG